MVNEARSLEQNPTFYSGGDSPKRRKSPIKPRRGGILFIFFALTIAVVTVFFSLGNHIPDMIGSALTEATDVQCANNTIDKEWVFIETLRQGSLPSDTIENLKEFGIEIGSVDKNGNFSENPKGTVLKNEGKLLSDSSLYDAFQSDASLYRAFNESTYTCAAFYYDDAAVRVFKDLGTNRNNYTDGKSFEEVLDSAMKAGSDITINSVVATKDTKTPYKNSASMSTNTTDAASIIDSVRASNPASTKAESALQSADVLKTADTISKEQRSSTFFLYFMETISKMKAGFGDTSEINAAMNFLNESAETEVVDTETGEVVHLSGTPLESPSLYAITSGHSVSKDETKNFSSDRILDTTRNQLSRAGTPASDDSVFSTIKSTLSSFSNKIKGSISRFITSSVETAELSILSPLIPTISSSLINNSFTESIHGISGGELLAEGAVNVGRRLAMASGGTAGDESAALAYNKEVTRIAALNNEVDRMTRSPLDPTSKNTFLGSLIYNFGVLKKSPLGLLIPSASADSTEKNFLTTFGNNTTLKTIGAVGTVHGSAIATFDTSTQYDPYNNQEFQDFINNNTTLNASGNREVKPGSYLAKFILYNNERKTPLGTIDAGILSSLKENSSFLSLFTNSVDSVSLFNSATDEEKQIASGAAFVNSSNNPYWNNYKYAQRYVSINRALSTLKQYSSDKTAYNDLKGFEGTDNIVLAFTEKYYEEHPEYKTYLSLNTFDTSNNNLIVPEVLHEASSSGLIELRKDIIK